MNKEKLLAVSEVANRNKRTLAGSFSFLFQTLLIAFSAINSLLLIAVWWWFSIAMTEGYEILYRDRGMPLEVSFVFPLILAVDLALGAWGFFLVRRSLVYRDRQIS